MRKTSNLTQLIGSFQGVLHVQKRPQSHQTRQQPKMQKTSNLTQLAHWFLRGVLQMQKRPQPNQTSQQPKMRKTSNLTQSKVPSLAKNIQHHTAYWVPFLGPVLAKMAHGYVTCQESKCEKHPTSHNTLGPFNGSCPDKNGPSLCDKSGIKMQKMSNLRQ